MAAPTKGEPDLAPVFLVGLLGIGALALWAMTRSSSASASTPAKNTATPLPAPAPTEAPPGASQFASAETDFNASALIDLHTPLNVTKDNKYKAPRPSYYYRLWTIRWLPEQGTWGTWTTPLDFSGTYVEDKVPGALYGTNIISYWRSPADDMVAYLANLTITNDAPGFWYAVRDQYDRSLDDNTAKRTAVFASSGRFGAQIHLDIPDNWVTKKMGLATDGHVTEFLPGNTVAPETVVALGWRLWPLEGHGFGARSSRPGVLDVTACRRRHGSPDLAKSTLASCQKAPDPEAMPERSRSFRF